MTEVSPRIAGVGICCLDHIVTAPRVCWGDTALVSDYFVQGGGLVATALVACARLGARCDFFSLLADDQTGDQVIAELIEERVSVDGIARIKGGKSPFSFIHSDEHTGERTIFHRPGAGLDSHDDLYDMDETGECDALLVDDIYPDLALAAAKRARAHGIPVVADLIPSPDNHLLLRSVDVLIAPKHFAEQIGYVRDLERALQAIHELGPTTAVITLGAEGWIYSDPSEKGRGEAFKVDIVDTTGAGDSFHGAFTYGLTRHWDTARCCEFASAVAAIKCTARGGRTGLPSYQQTIDFLKQQRRLDWE